MVIKMYVCVILRIWIYLCSNNESPIIKKSVIVSDTTKFNIHLNVFNPFTVTKFYILKIMHVTLISLWSIKMDWKDSEKGIFVYIFYMIYKNVFRNIPH